VTIARATIALLLLLASSSQANTADTEIHFLLQFVASSGCVFERNGSRHQATDAADHLRLKYRRGRKYADTAEHFIDRLASQSSWTGRTYTVECDGQVSESGSWLHQALQQYRNDPG